MSTVTKAKAEAMHEAREQLRRMLPPGSEVKTILRHTARSGITQWISPIVNGEDYSWLVARALGENYGRDNHEGIRCSGYGMDFGFGLVHSLSRALYPDGFECIGEKCPSNDHSNGDRSYRPHHHDSGRYALTQRWL